MFLKTKGKKKRQKDAHLPSMLSTTLIEKHLVFNSQHNTLAKIIWVEKKNYVMFNEKKWLLQRQTVDSKEEWHRSSWVSTDSRSNGHTTYVLYSIIYNIYICVCVCVCVCVWFYLPFLLMRKWDGKPFRRSANDQSIFPFVVKRRFQYVEPVK